jgi:hypothetical protein
MTRFWRSRRLRRPRGEAGIAAPPALALVLLAFCAPSATADLRVGGLAPMPEPSGETVQWSPVSVESSYKVAVSTDARGSSDRSTVYLSIPREPGETQFYTPEVSPGKTLYVGVSADNGLTWSSEEAAVGASPPAEEPAASQPGAGEQGEGEGEAEPSEAGATPQSASAERSALGAASSSKALIGTEDGSGWGPDAAQTLVQGHITWNRVELGSGPSVATSLEEGFKVLAIVSNTNDSTPLSQINPGQWGATVVSELQANPGISIAEAANESYYKGAVANPVQYGRMYLAAVEDMKAAGIATPLLFNMTGDYPSRGTWSAPTSWSLDSSGGGWLRDAVKGVPGLAGAILANGLSIHPYGAVGENTHDDWGVSAASAMESVTRSVLGSIPPFYVTEFGYDLKRCGERIGACSKQEQASKMQAAYSVFLSDPHIAGIWWYQSHDDGTGHFGFMNNNNRPRKAFKTLSAIAAAAGQ